MKSREKDYAFGREVEKALPPNVAYLIDDVAKEIGVHTRDVWSFKRSVPIPFVRQAVSYAMRVNGNMSLDGIAKTLGYSDHTTVFHNVERCRGLVLDYEQSKEARDPLTPRQAYLLRAVMRALKTSHRIWNLEKTDLAISRGMSASIIPLIKSELEE